MAVPMDDSMVESLDVDWVDARVDSTAALSAGETDVPMAEMLVATRVDSMDVWSAALMVAWTGACE